MILNGVKSLSYAANMQATRIAKAAGRRRGGAGAARRHRARAADLLDLLGLAAGRPCGPPALDVGVLESITRDRLIKALDVEEGAWPVADLRAADEAFLASTTREIQAVAAIDGTGAGRGARARAPARRRRPSPRPSAGSFDETWTTEPRKQG